MIKALKSFLGLKHNQEDDSVDTDRAFVATQALNNAAADTMLLAQDVTTSLQARIEDYAIQIRRTGEILSDALLLLRQDGMIESFNPAAESMFGWSKDVIVGQHISKLFKCENRETRFELTDVVCERVNTDRIEQTIQHEDFHGLHRNGSLIYVDVSISKFKRADGKTFYLMLIRDVTSRVENDKHVAALAEYNERLLGAINSSQVGIIICDVNKGDPNNWTIVFANSGFCEMTGYGKHEIVGQSSLRFLTGVDSLTDAFWTLNATLAEGLAGAAELKLYSKNGKSFWADQHMTPVMKDGVLKNWLFIYYDITELKHTHEELRKSEQHFRAFGEASSEAMLVHANAKLLDWNPRLREITGYTDQEISTMSPWDFVHPLEREALMAMIEQTDPIQYETLFLSKSGEVLEVAVNTQPVEWHTDSARIDVVRDVTHYKDAEVLLRCSRERYRTIIDNTIDLVCCFDHSFHITFVNQTFRDYFGVENDYLIGTNLLDFVPVEDQDNFKEYLESITPDLPVRRGLHRFKLGDELRWHDWIDRVIFDESGTFMEYQSVGRDVQSYIKNIPS